MNQGWSILTIQVLNVLRSVKGDAPEAKTMKMFEMFQRKADKHRRLIDRCILVDICRLITQSSLELPKHRNSQKNPASTHIILNPLAASDTSKIPYHPNWLAQTIPPDLNPISRQLWAQRPPPHNRHAAPALPPPGPAGCSAAGPRTQPELRPASAQAAVGRGCGATGGDSCEGGGGDSLGIHPKGRENMCYGRHG